MAGAGKKTFTAGETLTASDVNNYLGDQAVMYFGGTAARSSAIPTPTTGMTSYMNDTKQIESYNGSAWVGMSGLQLVKKQTIGTGVSSVTVTNAFSATYENYKIIISGGAGTTNGILTMKLGSSTSGYNVFMVYGTYSSNTVFGAFDAASPGFSWIGGYGVNGIYMNADIQSPFLAKYTRIGTAQGYLGETDTGNLSGIHKANTSYSDFTLTANTGTLTGGTIYVYGYGT